MSQQRKLIRQAIVTELKSADTGAKHVFSTRIKPYFQPELPAISVYFQTEPAEIFNQAPRELKKTTKYIVEIAAQAIDGVDDILDDIGMKVEDHLHNKDGFNGLLSDIVLTNSAFAITDDGQVPQALLLLTFDVTYLEYAPRESIGHATANVTPFSKVVVSEPIQGATDTTPEETQEIDIPQS